MDATHDDLGLPQAALLGHAARHGFAVTRYQLKRLRTAGLMPRPDVHHGGVRGSRSRYPSWAREQLVLVCSLHERERRFDELSVLVWWNGGWVEPGALRAAMTELLSPVAQQFGAYADRDPVDAADEVSSQLEGGRARSATGRFLRRRLPQVDDRVSLMFAMTQLVFGGRPAWDTGPAAETGDESLAELFERASGIDRAREDTLGDAKPWLVEHEHIADTSSRSRRRACSTSSHPTACSSKRATRPWGRLATTCASSCTGWVL